MSYDVTIAGDCFNYTFNVAGLFHDHMPGGLQSLDGLTGRQAVLAIANAFDRIDQTRHTMWSQRAAGDHSFCQKYDSPNGWGTTVGALIFLAMIMAACARNPRSKVKVWA